MSASEAKAEFYMSIREGIKDGDIHLIGGWETATRINSAELERRPTPRVGRGRRGTGAVTQVAVRRSPCTRRRRFADVRLAFRHEFRSRRGRGEQGIVAGYDSASYRGARLRVTDFDELSRVASYRDSASRGHKSSVLARNLLPRRPSVGRADSNGVLARRRPPGFSHPVHSKTPRRPKTRLMQPGERWRGFARR